MILRVLLVDDTPKELGFTLKEFNNRFAQQGVDFKYEIKEGYLAAIKHLREMNPYDVVLIDIVGVKYKELIRDIRALYPYLPIAMFSRQANSDEIIDSIDLGAQSFIFKLDLMLGARPVAPYDPWKDEKGWDDIINKIQRLVEDYRPIKRILEASPVIGWIRKKGDKDSVIEDQISFLKYVISKPKIATLFPDVLDTGNVGEHVFYEMPLFRMKSLRRLIFGESDQEKCLVISKDVLKQVLEVTFNHLYTEDRNSDIYAEFVQENYFRKYSFRLSQARELLVQLKNTEPSLGIQAYEALLEAKIIKVGEDELRNATDILTQLATDEAFIKSLEPPFLCMIHGDLHFDNILVDDRLPKKMTIKLIDPRGFSRAGYRPGVGDVAYDIGKLLHSANGYYDFIHAGYLIPDIGSFKHPSNDKVEMLPLKQEEWATVPEKQGGSGAIITSHKRVVQIWAWGLFDALADYIKVWISNSGYAQEDPNWWLRAKFNEAMHFCTMGKFHLQEDVGRAIAIQMRGIELMNIFYRDYESGAFNL